MHIILALLHGKSSQRVSDITRSNMETAGKTVRSSILLAQKRMGD